MTLRERIADWISGGALTQARQETTVLFAALERRKEREMQASLSFKGRETRKSDHYRQLASDLKKRLARIARQETKGANATVKRMARIARGEE